jgi:hypothetical protein
MILIPTYSALPHAHIRSTLKSEQRMTNTPKITPDKFTLAAHLPAQRFLSNVQGSAQF